MRLKTLLRDELTVQVCIVAAMFLIGLSVGFGVTAHQLGVPEDDDLA